MDMIPEVTQILLYREQRDWEDRQEGRTVEEREGKGGKGRAYPVIDPCSHLLRGHS